MLLEWTDKRKKIMRALARAPFPLTMAELSEIIGEKVSFGTIRPLLATFYIDEAGTSTEQGKTRKTYRILEIPYFMKDGEEETGE